MLATDAQAGQMPAAAKSLKGKPAPNAADEHTQAKPSIASQTPLSDSPAKPQNSPVAQTPQMSPDRHTPTVDPEKRPETASDADKPATAQKQTPAQQQDAPAGAQKPAMMQATQAAAQNEPDAGGRGDGGGRLAQQSDAFAIPGSESVPNTPEGVSRASVSSQRPSDTPSSDAANDPAGQIRQSIQSSVDEGRSQVTIRLNPPELGRVTVRFEENAGQITALVEVAKAQTRAEIQQALPEILRNLQEAGVQIRRIDLAAPPDQHQNPRDPQSAQTQAQQDFSHRQQTQQEGSAYAGRDNPVPPRMRAYHAQGRSDVQRISSDGENSINMLI